MIRKWHLLAAIALVYGGGTAVRGQTNYTMFPVASRDNLDSQPGHTRHVTLDARDSTVGYVINELIRQAHLQLSYNTADPLFRQHVSVHIVDINVMDALTRALRGTRLVAELASDGETIVVRHQSGTLLGERERLATGLITGRVTDSATGAGLGGAAVRVEGTKISAVTSDSGNFTLHDVPVGEQVLSARLFGYKPVDRRVTVVDSERTTVKIVMASVPTVLSGVVTTATGVQRKVEIGNDITTINVDSVMRVAPITSLTDLLETRVPGLTVLHSSGAPGDPSRLRLRGAGSLQLNNDPIVIVDGIRVYASQSDPRNANLAPSVESSTQNRGNINQTSALGDVGTQGYNAPSPVDQIDPNSIETIEVFKGPSASALYGSDAAAGVIVITTKHGRAGPTHWDLDLGQGVNWIPGQWPTNYYRFGAATLGNILAQCSWTDISCTVDSVVAFQALNDPRYSVFAHGSDQEGTLTVSGGVPILQYSLTGTGSGEVGDIKLPGFEQQRYDSTYGPVPRWMIRPDNLQTWGVNGSLTAQPTSTLRAALTSSLFNSNQRRSSLEGAILQLEHTYIAQGRPYSQSFGFTTDPILQNDVERATDQQLTSTDALTLSWEPFSWLPITATGGINTDQRTDETYIPYGVGFSGVDTSFGSYGLGRGSSRDQTLNAGTSIPVLGRVTLALGGNFHSGSTADFTAYTSLLAPGVSSPSSFPTTGCGSYSCSTFVQTTSNVSTYGWYFEPQLNLSRRFFAAPGFRLDGGSGGSHAVTSAGSLGGGLSAFPKIDFSYLAVDRQNRAPLWGVLTLFRPRVAFGYAGTQPLAQDRLRLFNNYQTGYSQNIPGEGSLTTGDRCPGVCLNSIGNTQLHPERTSELEGGFDADLWHGRLSLTYSQYNKTRHDAILAIPVAPSVAGGIRGGGIGNSTIDKNVGVIRNTGTEITVHAFLLQTRALSWAIGANVSNNNSLVVALNKGQAPLYGLGVVPGYPLFSQWEYPIVAFADANHDGVIEPNEVVIGDSLVYVGQQEPKYQTNLTTDITLLNGRLSIHGTFAYQNGLLQTNDGALANDGFALFPNTPNTPLATQAAVVAADCSGAFGGSQLSSFCGQSSLIGLMQTVNTFRFNDLSINYEVPRAISRWFRIPRMAVALQGSNLALHTNYRGKDPNVNAFSTVSAGDETVDLGEIPEPRTWWLKINVGN